MLRLIVLRDESNFSDAYNAIQDAAKASAVDVFELYLLGNSSQDIVANAPFETWQEVFDLNSEGIDDYAIQGSLKEHVRFILPYEQ